MCIRDSDTRSVLLDGEMVELTYKEFELLKMLVQNADRVLPREELDVYKRQALTLPHA